MLREAQSVEENVAAGMRVPLEGGVPHYVGSGSCRDCHEREYVSWHRSYHRTMTQYMSTNSVRADFHNVVLTNETTRFTLTQTNDQFWVRMEHLNRPGPGEPPAALDTPMGLVTGSHHMQVFWVPGDEGNIQVGFPFTWLIPEARWVPRNSTFIRPPDMPHRPEIWTVVCSRCHATGIEPRVDPVARTVETRAGALGISCEACHGPAERHVAARLAAPGDRPDAVTLRSEILHPESIDPARASQICGFCHSMKWFDHAESWRERGFSYRPGDDLEASTPIIRPSQVADIEGLAEYLRRAPGLLDDFFWPDGMIRVSGREYNGLIESPCYQGGQFSCLSCHSMHQSDPDDLLARNRTGNEACTQCHADFQSPDQLTTHTRHAAASSGSQCYNCHMPHTTYGVLKAIRSHQVSSPDVAADLTAGRPNACNLCHLDKPLAWTADYLRQWYSRAQPAPPAEFGDVAEATRLALSGDAGQRALIAWHLSWKPALEASGTAWTAPLLGRLLDDPYAAVRCIAERSMRANGEPVPTGYDYVNPPLPSSGAFSSVWEAWAQRIRALPRVPTIPNETLLAVDGLAAQEDRFDPWLRQRNERPVRLRE